MAFEVDANALTTLDSVKRHIGVSGHDDDALLITLINQLSGRIEDLANGRKFKARDWRFWLTMKHSRTLLIPQYPVIYVNRIAHGAQDALSVSYSGSAIRATAQVYRDSEGNTGGIRLVSYDSSGARTTNELTVASNGSASAMATAVTAVSGWTGTLVQDTPSADLHPTGGVDAKSRTVNFTYPDQDDSNYRIDYDTGRVRLVHDQAVGFDLGSKNLTSSFQGFLVEARCGFETIPAQIVWLANELVSQAYKSKPLNRSLASESLGDYSYSLASGVQIGDEYRELLMPYTDLAVGGAA